MIKKASHKLIILAAIGLVNSRHHALSILGLNENATSEEINKAYRKKSKLHHPDLNPTVNDNDIKMLNAARDFLLINKENNEGSTSAQTYQEAIPDVPDISEMSYEDIAKIRDELGREEFNKRFPDWEMELKHEMGLDEWNKTFEKYDPNYDPNDDSEYLANEEAMWDNLGDKVYDDASDIFNKLEENNELSLHINMNDAVNKYSNIISIPSWISNSSSILKEYNRLLLDKLNELLLKNVDELEITLEDIISYPNPKVIISFLSRGNNIEDYQIPDNLLSNEKFAQAIFLLLNKNLDLGERFINKYKDNKSFINGVIDSVNFLYWIRNNAGARMLILDLELTDTQRDIVKRWLKTK